VGKRFMGLQRVLAVINFSPYLLLSLPFSLCAIFAFHFAFISACIVRHVCVCVSDCACHVGVQYYYANYLFDISIEITMLLLRLGMPIMYIAWHGKDITLILN